MRFPTFLQRYGPRPSFTERSEASQIPLRVVPLYHRRRIVMLIGRSVFPSSCGRSPRADEVMAFGRRTVTMSFSGLRPIFAIGGSAGAVCGSFESRAGLRCPGGWVCGEPRGLCGAPEDGLAETVCGSYEPRGPQPPHAEARNSLSLRLRALRRLRTGFAGPIGQVVTPAAAHRRKPPRPPVAARF